MRTFTLILFTILLAAPISGYSQYHLVYKFEYCDLEGKPLTATPGVLPEYQEYYYWNGHYKSIYDGGTTWMEIYDPDVNERYSVNTEGDITEHDASLGPVDGVEIIHIDTSVIVNNYPCKAIKYRINNISTTLYYSDLLSVDHKLVKGHNHNAWNRIMEAAQGGIPLAFDTDYGSGILKGYVIHIDSMALKKSDFKPKTSISNYRRHATESLEKITSGYSNKVNGQPISNFKITGTAKQGSLSLPMELYISNPSSMLLSMKFGEAKFSFASNNGKSWSYNPVDDKVVVKDLQNRSDEFNGVEALNPSLKTNWKDSEVITFFEDDSTFKAVLITEPGRKMAYYFNKQSLEVLKFATEDNYFELNDYELFHGIPFATNYRNLSYDGEKPIFDFSITNIDFNLDLPDTIFSIPKELRYKIVKEDDEKSPKEYFDAAEQLSNEDSYDSAILLYKKAIALDDDNALYCNQLGIAQLNTNKTYEAIASFSKTLEINSRFHRAWYNLGYAKMILKDYKAAILDFQEAIRIEPNEPEYHTYKGLCYYNLDVYDTALISFNAAVQLDPDYESGHWNVAMSNYQLEDYNAALTAYNKSEEIGYVSSDLYNYRGICYYSLEDYESAVRDFLKAVNSDDPVVNYYSNLGDTYVQLSDSKKAIEAFESAISLDSTFAEGYNLIGLEYYKEGSYDAAISYFSEAISQNANEATYYDNRAQAKDAKMDFTGAVDDYSISLSLYPNDSQIYYLRGVAKSNLNDKFDACKDLKKAADMGLAEAKELIEEYCISNPDK